MKRFLVLLLATFSCMSVLIWPNCHKHKKRDLVSKSFQKSFH